MSARARFRALRRAAASAATLAALAGLAGACLEEPTSPSDEPPPGGGPPRVPPQVVVVNGLSETLSRLRLDTRTLVVDAATSGTWVNRARPSADRTFLLVAISGENAIDLVNAHDLGPRQSIDLGPGSSPWIAIATGPWEGIATSWLASEVRPLALDRGAAGPAIPVSPGPEGVAVAGRIAWVACTNWLGDEGRYGPGLVDVVDLDAGAVVATVEVAPNPQDVLVAADGRIHVLCTGTYGGAPFAEGLAVVIDPGTRTVVGTVPLGGFPGRFVESSAGIVWVTGASTGIARYDAATLSPLAAPTDADLAAPGWSAVDEDPQTGTVWAVHFDEDRLVAIDPDAATVTESWTVGDGPVDVTVIRP